MTKCKGKKWTQKRDDVRPGLHVDEDVVENAAKRGHTFLDEAVASVQHQVVGFHALGRDLVARWVLCGPWLAAGVMLAKQLEPGLPRDNLF